ncbi:predicted protein [Plenodomus lingam JN3]|uniref:Predicted protein n=2 Tax=Leptosphaeria maculans TaxID=5022 RepID=E5AC20_LEPMJ|nr:predicted protein [Plenodomus lingam JN3]CBY01211.1 predicted protein [Plenodomus lingam JN3]
MQLTPLFLAAAASGLAAAQPVNEMGNWDMIYRQAWASSGYKSQTFIANFTSSEYQGMNGQVGHCEDIYNNPQDSSVTCSEGFKATRNGSTISVEHTLPNKVTYYGQADIEIKTDPVGKSAEGRGIIKATEAVA